MLTSLLNDLPWTPREMDQLERRIHRIGQDGIARIHRLYVSKEDEHIGKVVTEKMIAFREGIEMED